jgi:hypothetical protein
MPIGDVLLRTVARIFTRRSRVRRLRLVTSHVVGSRASWQRRSIGATLLRKIAEHAPKAGTWATHTEALQVLRCRSLGTADLGCEAGDFSHGPAALRDGLSSGLGDHL